MPRALRFALAALALTACKSEVPMSIDITAGLETDAFTADPPVTRVDVNVTSLDGSIDATVSAAPGETFDVGVIKADQQISIEVTGFDATGAAVMRGRSLSGLPLDSIEGDLGVFIQRVGAWARPPGAIAHGHVGGIGASVGDRFVLLTGGVAAKGEGEKGDATAVEWYDFFALGTSTGTFSRVPESLVSFGEALVLVSSDGATWNDYSTQQGYVLTAPTGLAFADVAGGAAVPTGRDDGRVYVVGGTRRSSATKAVLAVDLDGTLTAYQLSTERKGAAAIWVSGVGLVVAGGSDTGKGVEVLSDNGTAFAPGDFDPDPVEGAAAVLDGTGVALLGGEVAGSAAPTRIVDPSCVASCSPKEVAEVVLPATKRTVAYSLGGTRVILVADESGDTGMTRAFLLDLVGTTPLTELPLREPRRGAIPVPTPLGGLALLGGEHADGSAATSVELFFTQ